MPKYVITVFDELQVVTHECVPAESFPDAIRWVHNNIGTSKNKYSDLCFELRTNDGEITQASYQPRRDNRAMATVDWFNGEPSSIIIQSAETALADLTERAAEGNDVSSQRNALRAAGVI